MSVIFHPNQALDNVTESKVVMAEARQLLDFFMRKNFINEFGESSMHIMKVGFWSQLKSSFPAYLQKAKNIAPKCSQEKIAPIGWHYWHVFATLVSRNVFSPLAWLMPSRRIHPTQKGAPNICH